MSNPSKISIFALVEPRAFTIGFRDLELELSNAGFDDDRLYHEGIRFCETFEERFGDEDALIKENMRRALAGFYANLDDMDTVDELFGGWLREEPAMGLGLDGLVGLLLLFAQGTERGQGRTASRPRVLAVAGVRR